MSVAGIAAPTTTFKRAGWRDTALLLACAWVIPMAVHLLPWAGERPLGAHLLPMFWTAFAAVYWYGIGTGLLVGLFAPALNLLLTGLPAAKFLGVLSFELLVFAVVTTLAVRAAPRFMLVAPLGYVVAKLASTVLQAATPVFGDIGGPVGFFGASIIGGLAGLAVLALINVALVRFWPKSAPADS